MSALVIGVGNPLRGDDGVGPAVAEQLRARGLPALSLEQVPPELYLRWEGCAAVVLVDACAGGAAPGTLRRFDPAQGPLPALASRLSSHGLGLGEALELARALGRLPASCSVYAVEGACFEPGAGLSEPVAVAASVLVERIAAAFLA